MRRRLVAYGTPTEQTTIAARARAHGVSLSAFLLARALGETPSPADTREADEWWAGLPPKRRQQIHGFLAHTTPPGPPPGMQPLPLEM